MFAFFARTSRAAGSTDGAITASMNVDTIASRRGDVNRRD
jgi:hypothetical protein